jgi:hypothetical protein
VELWSGSLNSFVADSQSGKLSADIWKAFGRYHGFDPSPSEAGSLKRSLSALAKCVAPLAGKKIGIICEYHLQFSRRRIDAVLLGRGDGSRDQATIVELKQWDRVELAVGPSRNVLVGNEEVLHPSEQALNYRNTLEDTHSAFVDTGMQGTSCAYCHDMTPGNARLLRDDRFSDLLYLSPLFDATDTARLCEYVDTHVGAGGGETCLETFRTGKFRPSPRLLDVLEKTITADHRWTLIDSQQIAYNAIWGEVLSVLRQGVRDAGQKPKTPIFLIRGGPGTGKTVIAVRLLRDALRNNLSAVHSTGGKAFTIAMRSAFAGAKDLFVWNMSLRDAPPKGIDLLLVDEAHRLRETSDRRFTPKAQRNRRTQFEELVNASRLTVFFVDENQYVRPDEIGNTATIKTEAEKMRLPIKTYDLMEQFRCGGCMEYIDWIDVLLDFTSKEIKPWGDSYSVTLADNVEVLERRVKVAATSGLSARIIAGFCWHWSDPNSDGSLVEDIKIGNWCRPWNRKAKDGRQYRPDEHPYTLWARRDEGLGQVGCIYSAQGFEFDVVGVIWGKDLVWRNGSWCAQKNESRDKPAATKSADSLRLFRNAYRVLLTRGTKETIIFCLDPETRTHIESHLNQIRTARSSNSRNLSG